MIPVIAKVSLLNWLCVKMPDGSWLPVTQLTDQQVRDYIECTEVHRNTTRIS